MFGPEARGVEAWAGESLPGDGRPVTRINVILSGNEESQRRLSLSARRIRRSSAELKATLELDENPEVARAAGREATVGWGTPGDRI